MTTKDIIARLKELGDIMIEYGISPWDIPMMVMLRRIDDKGDSKPSEHSVLGIKRGRYNQIFFTDGPGITYKEFLLQLIDQEDCNFWYVWDAKASSKTGNSGIEGIYPGASKDKFYIIANSYIGG